MYQKYPNEGIRNYTAEITHLKVVNCLETNCTKNERQKIYTESYILWMCHEIIVTKDRFYIYAERILTPHTIKNAKHF